MTHFDMLLHIEQKAGLVASPQMPENSGHLGKLFAQ